MRKKGILALVVIIAIFVALSYIFTDRWLESTMESVGSSMVGAKVEFDGVDFSFLKLKMRWDRLQVTDPKDTWRNMFETGHCDFDVAFEPLLSKKIIIEDFKMEGLELNTRRETDGALPKKAGTPRETPKIFRTVQNQLQEETAKMPVFNLSQYTRKVNVDSLWRMVNLKSPQKIDSLKTYYTQKYENWEKRLQNLPDEKELQNLQSQVQSIQVDQIKTVDEFQSALNKANRLYKQVDSLDKNFRQLKTDFQDDFKQVNTVDDIMKQWIQQDYQRVLNLANIPEISVQNVARILFGRQIIDKIQRVNGYVGTARYYSEKFKSTQPKKENPPRLKGQTIYFTSKRNWPKFWVKQIALSGEVWNDMKISGTVKNIVSQQKVIGQPTTIDINGTRRDQASVKLSGILDYLEEKPREKIELNLSRMPLSNVKLTDFALLPYKINNGSGQADAVMQFDGNDFAANIKFEASSLKFDFSDKPANMNQRLLEISRSIVSAIQTIDFTAVARQVDGKFGFSINSNLDNLIAGKMKDIVSGEVVKARDQLQQRVQQQVERYRSETDKLIAAQRQELENRLQQVQEQIRKQQAELEKKRKEIESRIEQTKKDLQKKLEEETKNRLKDIFKK